MIKFLMLARKSPSNTLSAEAVKKIWPMK